MQSVIEMRDVSKRYGDFALESLNLSIAPGTITGLVGANGAGKSTTIKLLLNLIRRDAGDIRILGMDAVADETAIKR